MAEPYKIRFTIDGLTRRTNNQQSNWRARHAESRKWKRRVAEAIIISKVGWPTRPLEFVKLKLTRGSSRAPDFDGLVSSFKHVIDGLIECEVLANDRMDNFDGGKPEYCWIQTDRNKGFIQVELEEMK